MQRPWRPLNPLGDPSPPVSSQPLSDDDYDDVPSLTPDDSPVSSASPSPTDDNFNSRQYATYTTSTDMGLFKKKGERKGKDTPEPQNPYAAQSTQDQYTSQAPPQYDRGNHVDRPEKSPAWTTQDQRYGNGGSYGRNGAYSLDKFDGGAQPSPSRPGGYGGLGPAEDRSALFGAAPDRYRPPQQPSQPDASSQSGGYGSYGNYGQAGSYGDGARYDDRELTEEEQREQDADAMKSEMKNMRRQDVSASANALRLALQAEETGLQTLNRLQAQGERLYSAERNLDMTSSQGKIALENGKTLETAAHMIHGPTWGGSKAREGKKQERFLANAAADKEERERMRQEQQEAHRQMADFHRSSRGAPGSGFAKPTLADRAKYAFELDAEDDEMEDAIESNLDDLQYAVGRVKNVALAQGAVADQQNKHIDRIAAKADNAELLVQKNRAQLNRVAARN